MKNFLATQSYYTKNDITYKSISLLLGLASLLMVFWTGSAGGFAIENIATPFKTITSISLLLYFVIPIHACYFITEGFEHGSAYNIFSTGFSRSSYIIGKFISITKTNAKWIIQFFGLYSIVFIAITFFSGSSIGSLNLLKDVSLVAYRLFINYIYLATYCSIIFAIGTYFRNTATSSIISVMLIFGDFMVSGYLRGTTFTMLQTIANNTLTTQIMKFSGIYVEGKNHIELISLSDHLQLLITPMIIIPLCLGFSLYVINKIDLN